MIRVWLFLSWPETLTSFSMKSNAEIPHQAATISVDMKTSEDLHRHDSIIVNVLHDSVDKRSSSCSFAEGQQKQGHSSCNSNLFPNS